MVLVALIPAIAELRRAARSIEQLAETLSRDLPPTLEAIRLTGSEISELTDDVGDGVKSASQTIDRFDRGLDTAKMQVENARITARSLFAGVRTAWATWKHPPADPVASEERLSSSSQPPIEFVRPSESESVSTEGDRADNATRR